MQRNQHRVKEKEETKDYVPNKRTQENIRRDLNEVNANYYHKATP